MKKPDSTNQPPIGMPSFGAKTRIRIDPAVWKKAMEETQRQEDAKIKVKVPTVGRSD
jgi:hypothetical protein